jgi:hypothetical protein
MVAEDRISPGQQANLRTDASQTPFYCRYGQPGSLRHLMKAELLDETENEEGRDKHKAGDYDLARASGHPWFWRAKQHSTYRLVAAGETILKCRLSP